MHPTLLNIYSVPIKIPDFLWARVRWNNESGGLQEKESEAARPSLYVALIAIRFFSKSNNFWIK